MGKKLREGRGEDKRRVLGRLKSFLLLVGGMREQEKNTWGKRWVRASPYSLPGLPGTAQSPQPHLLAMSGFPHAAESAPAPYPKAIPPPWCSYPSTASCTSGGPAHCPSSLLFCLPKATWSHAAIPKMHRGRGGGGWAWWWGNTSTLTNTGPLSRATLHSHTCTAAAQVQGSGLGSPLFPRLQPQ